jgi:hypothetical protein
MKKYLVIYLLLVSVGICQATSNHLPAVSTTKSNQDSLAAYEGKYMMKRNNETFYIALTLEKGVLVITESWGDKLKKYLERLNGDNFLVTGLGWSVEFKRDKDKKITQMIVSGIDTWNRVESK